MSKTVLIVEDNELNMKLFHDLLEAHGYSTLLTKDGMDALKIARQHRPDLILMDIQLPEVSGLEVTKWIKEDDELRSIPVIAVESFQTVSGKISFSEPLIRNLAKRAIDRSTISTDFDTTSVRRRKRASQWRTRL